MSSTNVITIHLSHTHTLEPVNAEPSIDGVRYMCVCDAYMTYSSLMLIHYPLDLLLMSH